eukprot:12956251-Ditylum_brightwellii.AAC.1
MVSTCVCTGCPGKKEHKTASSKECVWHKKFVNVNTKDIPNTLQQFTAKYSPKGHLDVADLFSSCWQRKASCCLRMQQQFWK